MNAHTIALRSFGGRPRTSTALVLLVLTPSSFLAHLAQAQSLAPEAPWSDLDFDRRIEGETVSIVPIGATRTAIALPKKWVETVQATGGGEVIELVVTAGAASDTLTERSALLRNAGLTLSASSWIAPGSVKCTLSEALAKALEGSSLPPRISPVDSNDTQCIATFKIPKVFLADFKSSLAGVRLLKVEASTRICPVSAPRVSAKPFLDILVSKAGFKEARDGTSIGDSVMAALALFEMTFTNPEAFVLGNDVSPENRADRALDVLERLTDAKGGKTREVRTRVAKDAFLTLCDPVKVELSTRSEWR